MQEKPLGSHPIPTTYNTWAHKEALKGLGLDWHPSLKQWSTSDADTFCAAMLIVRGTLDGAEAPESAAAPSPGGSGKGQESESGMQEGAEVKPEAENIPEYEQASEAPGRDVESLTDRELNKVLSEIRKVTGPVGDTARMSKADKQSKIVEKAEQIRDIVPGGESTSPPAFRIMVISTALGAVAGQGQPSQTEGKAPGKPQNASKQAPASPAKEGPMTQEPSASAKRAEAEQEAQKVFGPMGVAAIVAIADSGVNEDEVRRIAREVAREEDAEVVVPAIEAATKNLLDKIANLPVGQALAASSAPVQITITIADMPSVDATHMHHLAPKIAALASAKSPKGWRLLNIALVGPPGVGKTHVAEDVALLLGVPHGGAISLSGGVTESSLTGRLIPIGSGMYLPAPFVTAYQNGGVFLLDEMDAADPNVLLAINSALANGGFTVETRAIDASLNTYVPRHPDFVCLCGMNTWGTGATAQFNGRQGLDGATLDRWYPVFMDYDANIVAALFGVAPVKAKKPWQPSTVELDAKERAAWQGWWYAVKAKLEANASKRIWSPRIAQRVTGARSVGVARAEVVEDVFAGWKANETETLGALRQGPVFV